MSSDWIETTIGEQVTLQRGFDITKAEQRLGVVPVVSSSGISSYHDTAAVQSPGVVLGRKGVVGSVYFLDVDYWPHDTTLWVKNFHGNDQKFVYYFFKHFTPHLSRLDVGSANPTLNRNHVHPIRVLWPPISEQGPIAHILGTLDEKIDLNRQMNSTLEQIAQALFKRWFIDFEFTDENGNPYKSSGGRMVDSELGEIPGGWKVLPLTVICSRITDGSHRSPKSVENGYPMASVKDMNDWGFELSSCRHISEADYEELVCNDCRPLAGDVLIAKDGSYLKHIFVVEKDLDLVILSSIAILRTNEQMDSHLLAFSLRSEATLARMERYVSGAVLQRIVLKDFKQFPILVPPQETQKAWAQIVLPLIQRCWRNIDEIQTLTILRDILLPKLMSGKIRVEC